MRLYPFVLLTCLALALTGCGSDDAEPAPPTLKLGATATLSGPVPALVGQVAVTVGGQPATVTGGTWQAQVPLTDGSASVEVQLLLEGQTVAKRVVTVSR